MIDFEYEIFSDVSSAFRAKHPGIQIYSDVVPRPVKLPCVMLWQYNNRFATNKMDSSGKELFVDTDWQVDVYSNKPKGRRQECKALMADIDALMIANGAVRSMMYNTPNPDDDTVYRLTARYGLRLGADGTRYRR